MVSMRKILGLKLLMYALFSAAIFFFIGLASYGSLASLLVQNRLYESAELFWRYSLINGFSLGLTGMLLVIYTRFTYLYKAEKWFSALLLFAKQVALTAFIYIVGFTAVP